MLSQSAANVLKIEWDLSELAPVAILVAFDEPAKTGGQGRSTAMTSWAFATR